MNNKKKAKESSCEITIAHLNVKPPVESRIFKGTFKNTKSPQMIVGYAFLLSPPPLPLLLTHSF